MTDTRRKVADTGACEVYIIQRQGKPRQLRQITPSGVIPVDVYDDGLEIVAIVYEPKKEQAS